MRLFHVSETPNISVFQPRKPQRADLDQNVGLVWALCERTLPNFLTPRNCPRVCWHIGPNTTNADKAKFLPEGFAHVVRIEQDWMEALRQTTLFVYVFAPDDFALQDEAAGYYVSTKPQIPLAIHTVSDLPQALARRNTLLQTAENLWEAADAVQTSSLYWSLCRMAFAKPRKV